VCGRYGEDEPQAGSALPLDLDQSSPARIRSDGAIDDEKSA
jgi:hypothetical protein